MRIFMRSKSVRQKSPDTPSSNPFWMSWYQDFIGFILIQIRSRITDTSLHLLSSATIWNIQHASFLTNSLSCVHLLAISPTSQFTPVVSTLWQIERQQRRTASSRAISSFMEKVASSSINVGIMELKCMWIVSLVTLEMLPNASAWLIVNGVLSRRGTM